MNLIINNVCNRSCPYCFAKSKANDKFGVAMQETQNISVSNFERYLDFLAASRINKVRLLGGEPTLHPEFIELIGRARRRDFDIMVFTNGLWPHAVQNQIRSIPLAEWKVRFLFNVNEPSLQPAGQLTHTKESMKITGKQGSCGFNIYTEDFNLRFIADIIDECKLERDVRLGLAAPIVGTENVFVKSGVLKAVGKRLVSELRELEQRNVLGTFDCGFPLCMFSQESLGGLTLNSRGFRSSCTFPIDVGPNLTAWPCFPLGGCENVNMADFQNEAALLAHYKKRLGAFGQIGTMEECLTCKYKKRNQCCGGCLAQTLRNWVEKGDPELFKKMGWSALGRTKQPEVG